MATYFHGGSEIQAGGGENLQTLYLMNPNYITAYNSENHNHHHHNQNQTGPNMLLLNHPSATGGVSNTLSHAPPQQQQQFIGIPLPGSHTNNNTNDNNQPTGGRPSSSTSLHPHDHSPHQIPAPLQGLAVSRVHYNLWSPTVDPSPTGIPSADVEGQMAGFRRPATQGGLSLSLSPNQQGDGGRMAVTVVGGSTSGGGASVSNGVQGVILGSKYLKAAQELLDEVVHVGNYIDNKGGDDIGKATASGAHKEKAKAEGSSGGIAGGEGSSSGGGGGGKRVAEQLSTAQRQELQMKKAKLLNMLDEVEQRYRQYHNQMQVVVSSFEQAAGYGSAKSYTSLALQTISRQFRCLKDAITSQIKATSKSLGEDDSNGGPGKLEGGAGSRLRLVDHQLRQQRALQQLGMMQHNAWRPQRGLPERAVSVLRAWLFEHFLHPYPKDSDKHMLAKQTGLTRSQVSNWFINARVRLWKPMVEEMYLEEVKTQENNNGNTDDNTNTNISGTPSNSDPNQDQSISKTTVASQQHDQQQVLQHHDQGSGMIQPHHTTNDMISNMSTMSTTSSQQQGFTLIGSSSDMESLMARSPKKQRSNSDMQNSPSSILSMEMEMKPPDNRDQIIHNKYAQSHHQDNISNHGFNNPYINVHDIAGRFNPDHQLAGHQQYHGSNGVSLTLGLPHGDNLSLSGTHQHNFMASQGMQLGRRLDVGGAGDQAADFCGISMGQQPSHPTNGGYDSIDIQSRKRFAAQLLHDFVA